MAFAHAADRAGLDNLAWHGRLGLAAGIDKDGSRAAELLATGFDSVEFGTVTPRPAPGGDPGVAVLAARLAALAPRTDTRIGIGIGMSEDALPAALAAEWLCGLRAAWGAADYLSFNLSARRYRPLLSAEHLPLLMHALETVTAERQRQTKDSGRRVALTLKLPLGSTGSLPLVLAAAAADAGFDAVTAVLPAHAGRLARLHQLAAHLHGKAALLAVGGIRDAGDVHAAMASGADGVQVHTAFVEFGEACLPALRGSRSHRRIGTDAAGKS